MKRSFPVLSGILFSLLIGVGVLSAQDREVRTINGGVLNGKAVNLPKPEYPADAKKDNAEGSVSVTIVIDEDGNVTSANASEWQVAAKFDPNGTTGTADAKPANPLLREAAEKAAMEAKFSPTRLNGQPVKVTGVIVYNFVGDHSETASTKTVTGEILNGKATSLPLPAYPPAAKAVRAEGTVTVQIMIDEQGLVISASAVSGHPLLQRVAVDAARQATFAPTLLNGQPVKVTGVVTYNFVAGTKPDDK